MFKNHSFDVEVEMVSVRVNGKNKGRWGMPQIKGEMFDIKVKWFGVNFFVKKIGLLKGMKCDLNDEKSVT
jgi:hypothetical protein